MSEFPKELIEQCARAICKVRGKNPDDPRWIRYPGPTWEGTAWHAHQDDAEAILREIRHGELVTELKCARQWLDACLGLVRGDGPPNWDGVRAELTHIDAALKKAGAL